MNTNLTQTSDLSPTKQALLALKDMESRLNALEYARTESIAIIGMACRFPGNADTPEAFWQLLSAGRDAIIEVPKERWDIDAYYDPDPDAPGKIYTRYGGFLRSVDQFDPQFFGISPREAMSMDPQQRLLLEVSWEALENANLAPDQLFGSSTGVFVGITNMEYGALSVWTSDVERIDPYYGTGGALGVAAGRLSYVLGFTGPSFILDTACSSSLIATHLACQSLRQRECDLALVGGVNLIYGPETFINFCKARMLSTDGRCKTFDRLADGYSRGEGCGVIILKRVSDAKADRDNIIAVIRGSAVNQDGPSGGLTVPHGPSQESVIRQALANGKVEPGRVSYIEAHGTGTSLGDPIEMGALANVFGKSHSQKNPLLVGSVKTNFGHLESAAGIAGLMKVLLALQHKQIPPHLHFKDPNPHIHWEETPVMIPTTLMPWETPNPPRIAGVSSFSFSGTNAHIVLEEAPDNLRLMIEDCQLKIENCQSSIVNRQSSINNRQSSINNRQSSINNRQSSIVNRQSLDRPLHLLTMSAKTPDALKELARRYDDHLSSRPDMHSGDVCFTANTCRAQFQHRLTVIGESLSHISEKLAAFKNGQEMAGLCQGHFKNSDLPKIAFLFTGQGAQYVGMGRQLYETQPTFRKTLDRCDEILRSYLETPLLAVLYPKPYKSAIRNPQSEINMTAYTQPALFALEYALAKLWLSWGIEPTVVMGHSVGEYVAACIAEVFSLEDGLKLIAGRGRLMQTLCETGDMLVVATDEAYAVEAIQAYASDVSIAAINGPENIVLSGKHEAIQACKADFEAQGIKTRQLKVSHAFHSPLMEPMIPNFERIAREITYSSPSLNLCSNLTAQLVTNEITSPEYWCRHVRQPVRFSNSIETLFEQGYEVFLEIGPKPTLLGMARQIIANGEWRMAPFDSAQGDSHGERSRTPKSKIQNSKSKILWLPSLRSGQEDWQQILQSLGELYVRGVPVDWSGFDQDYSRHKVVLPTYPFQRQRYWIETAGSRSIRHTKSEIQKYHHPLLGQRLHSAALKNNEIVFESLLGPEISTFLSHHRVFETAILPAAGYLEMGLAAGRAAFKSDSILVEDFVIHQALVFPEHENKTIQVVLTPEDTSAYAFQIFSLANDGDHPDWTCHASGKVILMETQPSTQPDLSSIQTQCLDEIPIDDFYQLYVKRGIEHGSNFRAIEELRRSSNGEAIALIQLPESLSAEPSDFYLHPVVLDACFQVLGAIFPDEDAVYTSETRLPVSLERMSVYRRPSDRLWCIVKARVTDETEPQNQTADLFMVTPEGELIAEVEGMKSQRIRRETLLAILQASSQEQDWLYQIVWQPCMRLGLPPEYLSAPVEIQLLLNPDVKESISRIKRYREILSQLENLSVAYLLKALRQMGWTVALNQRFSTGELASQLGVITQHRRLFGRLLEILAEEHIIRLQGDEWEVITTPEIHDPQVQIQTLITEYPDASAELTLLERCGTRLAEVLKGEWDPLQLLFPDGDLTTLTQFYQSAPGPQVMNTLVQRAISVALERLPQGRGVRMLEIGAGTGGTTAYLLPCLPAQRTEYVFTDVSPLFTTQAQKKFSEYPFVRYQLLDIEQAPSGQEFDEHQSDIIVAANVLHATRDLRETVAHIHSLLAPGGILVLLEGTSRLRWVDLTFGLTEGWWRFADSDLRSSYPLLSSTQWQALLLEKGFIQVAVLSPEQEDETFTETQVVIVAQKAKDETPSPLPDLLHQGGGMQWLIFADGQGIGVQLGERLKDLGTGYILVFPGKTYERANERTFRINPASPADFQRLMSETTGTDQLLKTYVVHLWSLYAMLGESQNSADLEMAQMYGCGSVLHLVQALGKAEFLEPPSLWLITQGAMPVSGQNPNVAQSPLWGMGNVIATEHPELNCVRIDLDSKLKGDEAQVLLEEIWSHPKVENPPLTPPRRGISEDQVAFRDNVRYGARLVRLEENPPLAPPRRGISSGDTSNSPPGRGQGWVNLIPPFRSDSTYLITGGLGALGLLVAQWMVAKQGVKHLVLVGRSGVKAEVSDQLQTLRDIGTDVLVAQADVSDTEQLARVLTEIEQSRPPLRGIIHAAGVLDDGVLASQNWKRFKKVLTPKVLGAWNLHKLTEHLPLDFFVLFSSAAALLWSPAQANHVAANTFLDSLAHYRRSRGLAGMSINWGVWSEIGVAARKQADEQIEMKGMGSITPQQGLQILEQLFLQSPVQVGVIPVNWSQFLAAPWTVSAFFTHFRQISAMTTSERQPDFVKQLASLSVTEQREHLIMHIQSQVARVLGLPSSQPIDLQQGFFDLGMDSLTSIELKNRLQTSLKCSLPPTIVFKYPTVEALADYLAQEVLALDTAGHIDHPSAEDEPSKVLKKVKQMSEKELEQLINAEFDALVKHRE
jgi:acyl transferase domain-containing protein/NAD(P)-dependent dehydrogenase (short-subunit alcohol dehydrogenase family)/acyl carrier protein